MSQNATGYSALSTRANRMSALRENKRRQSELMRLKQHLDATNLVRPLNRVERAFSDLYEALQSAEVLP